MTEDHFFIRSCKCVAMVAVCLPPKFFYHASQYCLVSYTGDFQSWSLQWVFVSRSVVLVLQNGYGYIIGLDHVGLNVV